ncbi:hypothetical protein [Streptomyces jumonjinensis]|uniref:hypothetical protein n=1 Tax=Streptomyces jumonjinensis TaxID=1945 RepID=UPI001E49C271|nr:hypothetical protein [Streptomyces jumonjinensis]
MAAPRDLERTVLADIHDLALAERTPEGFFHGLTPLLRDALRFDAGCWHGADPVTGFLTSTVSDGLDLGSFEQAAQLEIWSDDATRFAAIRAAGRLADTVHRATRGHPEHSVRYRELLSGHHFVDELRINFDHHGGRWGSAALMRERDQRPYGADELRLAARAARAIGTALSRYALPAPAAAAATKMDGPAVAVISAAGRLTAADPAAEALLAELADDPRSGALPGSRGSARTALPTALTTIVEQARGRLGPGAAERRSGPG